MAVGLLDHTIKQSAGTATSSAIDSTGAQHLSVLISSDNVSTSITGITDNKGNTYALSKRQASSDSVVFAAIYDCLSPVSVGSGHTVTISCSAGNAFFTAVFAAFSGYTGQPALLATNGGSATGTSIQPGSVTPSVNNCLILALVTPPDHSSGTIAVDSGFTIIDQHAYSNGVAEGAAAAYLVQTSAGAINPTFSNFTTGKTAAVIAVYGIVPPPPAWLTQGGVHALCGIGVDLWLTQGGVHVLGALQPPMLLTQGGIKILADRVPCATNFCQCWRITRRDDVVYRFTSLDEDFEWFDGVYKSCSSLNPSAAQDTSDIGDISNMELTGIISDDSITEEALYGGLFDDAFIEVWEVPYEDDGNGTTPRRLAAGWTGNLSHGKSGFKMEVVGPGAKLAQQSLVDVYAPTCRWTFGSTQCGFDREGAKVTGTVTAVTNRGQFACDIVLASTSSDLVFADGLVRWTSGRNEGVECEVKSVDFGTDGATVVLWDLAGLLIAPGDTFDLLPGCSKDTAQCKIYGRFLNFGGYPDIPGADAVLETPDAKVDS